MDEVLVREALNVVLQERKNPVVLQGLRDLMARDEAVSVLLEPGSPLPGRPPPVIVSMGEHPVCIRKFETRDAHKDWFRGEFGVWNFA